MPPLDDLLDELEDLLDEDLFVLDLFDVLLPSLLEDELEEWLDCEDEEDDDELEEDVEVEVLPSLVVLLS